MSDPATAAVAAGGTLADTALSFGLDLFSSSKQASRSRKAAEEANRFTEHMSRHKYQNMIYDLRAAGMNPLLAVGGGASAGGGGQGAMASPQLQAGSRSEMASTALHAIRQKQELNNMKAQAFRDYEEGELKSRQTELAHEQQKGQEIQNVLNASMIPSARNDAKYRNSRLGKGTQAVKNMTGDLFNAIGGLGSGLAARSFLKNQKADRKFQQEKFEYEKSKKTPKKTRETTETWKGKKGSYTRKHFKYD
jgi:hypothetical protein